MGRGWQGEEQGHREAATGQWAALALLSRGPDRWVSARTGGSGGGLPGLVLQGEPLHPLLKLRPEVADQALRGGEGGGTV